MGEFENPEAIKAAAQENIEKSSPQRESLVNILNELGIKYEKGE